MAKNCCRRVSGEIWITLINGMRAAMNLWYVVEEKSLYDKERKQIGLPISAKIVEIFPRNTDGFHEWHDTETIDGSVYILRK